MDSVFHLYVGSGVQAQALSLHHRHFYLLNELRGRLISDMVCLTLGTGLPDCRAVPAMGLSSAFLGLLFLSGTLGLTTSPTRGRLHCYTCSFAKPCYPVLTECREDEVCGVSVGTSEQNKDVIERKGCLPRAQCPLLGHTTYWSRSYTLQHQCCEQDLCNTAASQRPPSLPLMTLLPLAAIFGWGVHIVL